MKRDRMAELQVPEGFRLFIRHLRRGVIICKFLFFAFSGCAGIALMFHGGIPWSISAFIMGLACGVNILLHVGRRYISALKVAEHPEIVYWVHSINPKRQGQITDMSVTESKNLKLHLKDGMHLEIDAVHGISQAHLRDISFWLRERNPSMRCGYYDNTIVPPSPTHD
jgi:hypothetical protein